MSGKNSGQNGSSSTASGGQASIVVRNRAQAPANLQGQGRGGTGQAQGHGPFRQTATNSYMAVDDIPRKGQPTGMFPQGFCPPPCPMPMCCPPPFCCPQPCMPRPPMCPFPCNPWCAPQPCCPPCFQPPFPCCPPQMPCCPQPVCCPQPSICCPCPPTVTTKKCCCIGNKRIVCIPRSKMICSTGGQSDTSEKPASYNNCNFYVTECPPQQEQQCTCTGYDQNAGELGNSAAGDDRAFPPPRRQEQPNDRYPAFQGEPKPKPSRSKAGVVRASSNVEINIDETGHASTQTQNSSNKRSGPGSNNRNTASYGPGSNNRNPDSFGPGSNSRNPESYGQGSPNRNPDSYGPGSNNRDQESYGPGSNNRSPESYGPGSSNMNTALSGPGKSNLKTASSGPGSNNTGVPFGTNSIRSTTPGTAPVSEAESLSRMATTRSMRPNYSGTTGYAEQSEIPEESDEGRAVIAESNITITINRGNSGTNIRQNTTGTEPTGPGPQNGSGRDNDPDSSTVPDSSNNTRDTPSESKTKRPGGSRNRRPSRDKDKTDNDQSDQPDRKKRGGRKSFSDPETTTKRRKHKKRGSGSKKNKKKRRRSRSAPEINKKKKQPGFGTGRDTMVTGLFCGRPLRSYGQDCSPCTYRDPCDYGYRPNDSCYRDTCSYNSPACGTPCYANYDVCTTAIGGVKWPPNSKLRGLSQDSQQGSPGVSLTFRRDNFLERSTSSTSRERWKRGPSGLPMPSPSDLSVYDHNASQLDSPNHGHRNRFRHIESTRSPDSGIIINRDDLQPRPFRLHHLLDLNMNRSSESSSKRSPKVTSTVSLLDISPKQNSRPEVIVSRDSKSLTALDTSVIPPPAVFASPIPATAPAQSGPQDQPGPSRTEDTKKFWLAGNTDMTILPVHCLEDFQKTCWTQCTKEIFQQKQVNVLNLCPPRPCPPKHVKRYCPPRLTVRLRRMKEMQQRNQCCECFCRAHAQLPTSTKPTKNRDAQASNSMHSCDAQACKSTHSCNVQACKSTKSCNVQAGATCRDNHCGPSPSASRTVACQKSNTGMPSSNTRIPSPKARKNLPYGQANSSKTNIKRPYSPGEVFSSDYSTDTGFTNKSARSPVPKPRRGKAPMIHCDDDDPCSFSCDDPYSPTTILPPLGSSRRSANTCFPPPVDCSAFLGRGPTCDYMAGRNVDPCSAPRSYAVHTDLGQGCTGSSRPPTPSQYGADSYRTTQCFYVQRQQISFPVGIHKSDLVLPQLPSPRTKPRTIMDCWGKPNQYLSKSEGSSRTFFPPI